MPHGNAQFHYPVPRLVDRSAPEGSREKVAETPDEEIEAQGCAGNWRFARYRLLPVR